MPKDHVRPRLSYRRIVAHDWLVLFGALGIPIIWIINIAFPYLREGAVHTPEIAAVITLACGLLIGWRIWRIHYLFSHGIEAAGVVTRLKIVRDRGRLEYTFTANKRTIHAWFPVHKTKRVLQLDRGAAITVLYDKKNPQFCIVQDLFEQTS